MKLTLFGNGIWRKSQSAANSFLAELDCGIEVISLAPERWPFFVHGTRDTSFIGFPSS